MDDDDPFTTGGIGILGTAASQDIMKNCDTLLIPGSTFPYIEFYLDPNRSILTRSASDFGIPCSVAWWVTQVTY